MGASLRITDGAYNGSNFSPKLYGTGWGGGSTAQITTYQLTKYAEYGEYLGKAGGNRRDTDHGRREIQILHHINIEKGCGYIYRKIPNGGGHAK